MQTAEIRDLLIGGTGQQLHRTKRRPVKTAQR
jgi:hypothetical protein